MRIFVIFLTLTVLTGCGDDEDTWEGDWRLHTIDNRTVEQILNEGRQTEVEEKKNDWHFHEDTWDFEFEAEIKVENVAVEQTTKLKVELNGTYTLSGDRYTLTITNITEQESVLFSKERTTGTWTRSGSTLTLNGSDGRDITFKADD